MVEGGGGGSDSASFDVSLASQPTSFVQVTISSVSPLADSLLSVTLPADAGGALPIVLTYGPGNWSVPQSVQLQAVDDEEDRTTPSTSIQLDFAVTLTQDPLYVDGASTLSLPTVGVAVFDDEHAAVDFSEVSVALVEAGAAATYDITVASCPQDGATPIVVEWTHTSVTSMTGGPGGDAATAASVTSWVSAVGGVAVGSPTVSTTGGFTVFSDSNCSQTVTVSVMASDDPMDAAVSPWTVGLVHTVRGDDTRYDSAVLRPAGGIVNVDVYDDDKASVLLSRSDLSVTEGGNNDTYTVRLASEPAAAVTITLDVLPGTRAGQVGVSPRTITFTSGNYNVPVTVDVVAISDDIEGEVEEQAVVITHDVTSADGEYDGAAVLPGPNVTVNVYDI